MATIRFLKSVWETYRLICSVRDGLTPDEVARFRRLSKKQVYKHLSVLLDKGMVVKTRKGLRVTLKCVEGFDFTDLLRKYGVEAVDFAEELEKEIRALANILGTADFVLGGRHLITFPHDTFVASRTYEFMVPWEKYSPEIEKATLRYPKYRLIPAPRTLIGRVRYRGAVPLPENPLEAYFYCRAFVEGTPDEVPTAILHRHSNFIDKEHNLLNALRAVTLAALGRDWKPVAGKLVTASPPALLRFSPILRVRDRYGSLIEKLSRRNIVIVFDSEAIEIYARKILAER